MNHFRNPFVTARSMRAIVLVVVVSCVPIIAGCTATPRGPHRTALVNHVVYCKLKNPADVAEIIADCDRTLRPIPGVVAYFAGPRLDTGRPNVDTSFDVALYLGFNSEADYQRYLDHPAHKAAVAKWLPRFESIRFCDTIDPTP